jgi:SAM-dependent methyltransferase
MTKNSVDQHLFRCPVTGEPLREATPKDLVRINADIEARAYVCRDGTPVSSRLSAALCTADLKHVYRAEDGVFWLLPGLAIVPVGEVVVGHADPDKTVVQEFYDEYGWVKREDGLYSDTADFTDTRPIARDYQVACNRRISLQLRRGTYLLDVASGAVPLPEYLAFSDGYTRRICVDFSIRALREAQGKLGDRGLYVLGDITQLPFLDRAIDDVISLHTIYHVPQAQQTTAVDELVRVVKPGGRVLIVYVWPSSLAMDAVARLRRLLGAIKRRGRPAPRATVSAEHKSIKPSLYFCPQGFDWYRRDIEERHGAKLRVWAFADSYRALPGGAAGRVCMQMIRGLETLMPRWAGRWGKYPMFVIDRAKA